MTANSPGSADGTGKDTSGQGFRINFELTNGCNFSCLHCLRTAEEATTFLPVDLVRTALAEVRTLGPVDWVTFGGGEPTLHPRFDAVLELLAQHNHRFAFVTNGWNFQRTYQKLLPHLDRLVGIAFSLDGARAETHDALRRPGAYREVLQALLLCRMRGIPTHINMVITRTNREEMESMALLAGRLGCTVLDFGHCQPTPEAVAAGLVLSAEERRRAETEIAELQRIFRLRIRLSGDRYSPSVPQDCPQLRLEEYNIDHRGRLTFCCMLSRYRGGLPGSDVVADLNEAGFGQARDCLIKRIDEVKAAREGFLACNAPTDADHFTCTHCLVHFGKAPEIRRILNESGLPDNPAGENVHARD